MSEGLVLYSQACPCGSCLTALVCGPSDYTHVFCHHCWGQLYQQNCLSHLSPRASQPMAGRLWARILTVCMGPDSICDYTVLSALAPIKPRCWHKKPSVAHPFLQAPAGCFCTSSSPSLPTALLPDPSLRLCIWPVLLPVQMTETDLEGTTAGSSSGKPAGTFTVPAGTRASALWFCWPAGPGSCRGSLVPTHPQPCSKGWGSVQRTVYPFHFLLTSLCVVSSQGDKDFPPAAAQVAHQKPHASMDKHVSPRTQHIQQPRK